MNRWLRSLVVASMATLAYMTLMTSIGTSWSAGLDRATQGQLQSVFADMTIRWDRIEALRAASIAKLNEVGRYIRTAAID